MAEDMEARFSLSYTDYKKGGAEMIYLALTGSVPRSTFSWELAAPPPMASGALAELQANSARGPNNMHVLL